MTAEKTTKTVTRGREDSPVGFQHSCTLPRMPRLRAERERRADAFYLIAKRKPTALGPRPILGPPWVGPLFAL